MSAANDNPEPQRASRRQRSRRQNENTPPLRRPRRARNLVDITDNLRFNETDHLFEKNVDYDPASPNYCRHVMQPMNMVCPDCNALLFSEELLRGKFSMCCAQGKVQLEPLPDPPQPLRALLPNEMKKVDIFETKSAHITTALPLRLLGHIRTKDLVVLMLAHTHFESKGPHTIELRP
ncbi:hypothetical protein MUCCIDRAFT_111696 [Mucor lusitanicus CBS 277.49]|uniref:Uncharacterized protein n=1 Tax=Mucor lusitanicus CBS 277.49 TaxID=747725 RepID=A0A168KF35_MUCCL|nr:hypothetical protein MUCCIDRAFT_111696 [Mucor lusitanicus CBS 277.49]